MSDEIRYKVHICPHCGGDLRLSFHMNVELSKAEVEVENWAKGLTESQIYAVEQAEKQGLIAAFKEAVDARNLPETQPKDMKRFFITFMKTCRPKQIPSFALSYFINTFKGQIDVWASQGVAVILSDSKIKRFVPTNIMTGASIGVLGNTHKGKVGRLDADESVFLDYVRTKHGYAMNGSLLLNELRRKSIGDFATVSLIN